MGCASEGAVQGRVLRANRMVLTSEPPSFPLTGSRRCIYSSMVPNQNRSKLRAEPGRLFIWRYTKKTRECQGHR